MKKPLLLPIIAFLIGLVVADYVFGVDVKEMFEGAGNFILGILKGPGN